MKLSISLATALAASSTFAFSQIPFQETPDISGFSVHQSQYSPDHSIRIKQQQNDTLCDARSKQYTGWLDVGSKHLFFWYFESQDRPAEDPLLLWMTGGPGGSSMLGLLQELGPCLINEHGNGTVYNENGWSKNANILFVDQPAGVGFSYMDEDIPLPSSSFEAAADMHHLLQLFTTEALPELKGREFHITGESYAGHYVPTLGAQIVTQNLLYPKRPQMNLQSIFVGNAYVSPLDTAFGYWETLCTTNPGVKSPVFNQTRCDLMATHLPRCLDLSKVCYSHPDVDICEAAGKVCWDGVIHHYDGESGGPPGSRNRFDIAHPCEAGGDLCYKEIPLIVEYLNKPWVFEALGVPKAVANYSIYNINLEYAFASTGDLGISTEPQVLLLLDAGIDVLFYQGNLDLACNTAGNLQWANSMRWKGQPAFVAEPKRMWMDGKKEVGWYKEVVVETKSGRETTFAMSTIDGAGHLVPFDKPREALRLVEKWLSGRSFA